MVDAPPPPAPLPPPTPAPAASAAPNAASAAPNEAREVAPASRAYTFRGEGTGAFQRWTWNVGRLVSRVLSMLMFRLHVSGQAAIPKTGGVLLVTNHQSFLDPWLIGIAPARQLHYMARDTLFKGGKLHWLMETWNVFPVKRGTADLGAIRTAVERLEKGFVVNIFPEGTRSEDGTIQPIAPGVALIVNRVKSDVPIMPVIVDGAYAAWPRKAKFPRPGPIRIVYGKPIPASEWRGLAPEALAWRLRRELVEAQERLGSQHAAGSRKRYEEDFVRAAAEPLRGRRKREVRKSET